MFLGLCSSAIAERSEETLWGASDKGAAAIQLETEEVGSTGRGMFRLHCRWCQGTRTGGTNSVWVTSVVTIGLHYVPVCWSEGSRYKRHGGWHRFVERGNDSEYVWRCVGREAKLLSAGKHNLVVPICPEAVEYRGHGSVPVSKRGERVDG
jgi:hypothetical protein